jgi:hypothetical protein
VIDRRVQEALERFDHTHQPRTETHDDNVRHRL